MIARWAVFNARVPGKRIRADADPTISASESRPLEERISTL
jgi:hypothetical protein